MHKCADTPQRPADAAHYPRNRHPVSIRCSGPVHQVFCVVAKVKSPCCHPSLSSPLAASKTMARALDRHGFGGNPEKYADITSVAAPGNVAQGACHRCTTLPTRSPEAVARPRFPQNPACRFPAPDSSAVNSQHRECLQPPVWETQLTSGLTPEVTAALVSYAFQLAVDPDRIATWTHHRKFAPNGHCKSSVASTLLRSQVGSRTAAWTDNRAGSRHR